MTARTSRLLKTAVVTGGAAALLLAAPSTSGAWSGTVHTVQVLGNNGHPIIGQAETHTGPYGVQGVKGVRNQESWNPFVPWDLVCNYQGWIGTIYPDGTLAFAEFSSLQSSCTTSGWFDYPDYEDAIDPTGSGYKHKWKSNATGGNFWTIGTIYA